MIGNEDARLAVMKWLSRWIDGSRPLLLVGPSGVGKTTLVQVLARKFDYDLIEMNASDTRNREDLETLIHANVQQYKCIWKNNVIILG